jgi:hypothetical protein
MLWYIYPSFSYSFVGKGFLELGTSRDFPLFCGYFPITRIQPQRDRERKRSRRVDESEKSWEM